MKPYLKLIWVVLKHKWFVLIAGRRLKVPLWRLLIHDLSKFSPAEFGPYARHFYGGGGDDRGFAEAWWHHYFHNSHHWEHYVSRDPNERGIPAAGTLPMPEVCVREMVADWLAAGKAYNGAWPDPANFTWYEANRARMRLHAYTEARIDTILVEASKWTWKGSNA